MFCSYFEVTCEKRHLLKVFGGGWGVKSYSIYVVAGGGRGEQVEAEAIVLF